MALHAALLNSLPDPVLAVDGQGQLLFANPAAHEALAPIVLPAPGSSIDQLPVEAEVLSGILRGAPNVGDFSEWVSADGRTFSARASEVRGPDGAPVGRVITLRDITRHRRMRENQKEFTSTVSHDMRTPLTYMKGYMDMLPMIGSLTDKQRDYASRIASGIEQLADLVDKILDASRLDPDGNYQLNREPCDLGTLVDDVANMHLAPAERKGLVLEVAAGHHLPVLSLDVEMVRRAMNCLVDNAVKYTPEGGRVTLAAHVEGDEMKIEVKDTGLGISPEHQKRLFERFQRVRRPEHTRVRGSGLGLYIVRRVAETHGGRVWVKSELGVGSTFGMVIPISGPNLVGSPHPTEG
jgi:signal transduction histidine kinase